jgi:serine/threonine-protein kinase
MSTVAIDRTVSDGSQSSVQHSSASAISRLPHYDLLAMAGRSALTEVWQVRDRRTGRLHALKQLESDSSERPAAHQFLLNEAEIGCKIASDYVVRICDMLIGADAPYIVFEWLHGQTLEAHLPRGQRLSCSEALWVARQCAQGMHALLVAGYVHGEINPSNIFVCHDGSVKLINLGFARPDQFPAVDLAERDNSLLPGIPESLSPDNQGSISRDVHCLGITLHRMLTGAMPFDAATIADIPKQQQESSPTRLRHLAPEVPREVADFVHRLLAKQPLRRGNGLSWLIHELIGLELLMLP